MNLPNYLSILRIVLVSFFIGALFYHSQNPSLYDTIAIVSFALACVTDALDGFLARRLKQETVLGSYIDPLADKILILSGFLALAFMTHLPESMRIPVWLVMVVVLRDAVILIGAMLIYLTKGNLHPQPLWIGKTTTVVQMITLLSSLVSADESFKNICFYLTAFFTVISGVGYLRLGNRMLGPEKSLK